MQDQPVSPSNWDLKPTQMFQCLPGAHSAGLDCLLTAGAQPEGGRPAKGGRETLGGGEAEGAVGPGSPGAQTAALSLVEIPPDTVL